MDCWSAGGYNPCTRRGKLVMYERVRTYWEMGVSLVVNHTVPLNCWKHMVRQVIKPSDHIACLQLCLWRLRSRESRASPRSQISDGLGNNNNSISSTFAHFPLMERRFCCTRCGPRLAFACNSLSAVKGTARATPCCVCCNQAGCHRSPQRPPQDKDVRTAFIST